eukprot:TRINITY_DN45976_c0_g1_i1.p1 TRINITY_DN45976_c0_g1~~TRINITY_DN45976_c0_g1_i1.p1  ORF type:complete len:380 (-),score=31.30 TRINITY_DN45976_c0_g1_i1:43-1119(-)
MGAMGSKQNWLGDYRPHKHCSFKNIGNAVLCAAALVPSYIATWFLFTRCPHQLADGHLGKLCRLNASPGGAIAMVNLLFFANVSVGFWVIGLLQRSMWLIDPYWTLIPPLIGHFYQLHPLAVWGPNSSRSMLSLGLIWLWALRLTHSYFRREEWKFGQREDWRYTKMANDYPRLWPIISFFTVGVAQQPMLVGVTLPLFSVHFCDSGLVWTDLVAAALGLCGMAIAWHSDTTLHRFMAKNEELSQRSQAKVPLLLDGLWRWSRHPNYFGEQLFWWSFAMFSIPRGDWWAVSGTLFNSLVLATVTVMTEQRMLNNWPEDRATLYRKYQQTTSPLFPMPNRWWSFLRCSDPVDLREHLLR